MAATFVVAGTLDGPATGATRAPGVPSGVTNGSLLVGFEVIVSSVNPDADTANGFTKKYSNTDLGGSGQPSVVISWKRSDGTEPSTYAFPTGTALSQSMAQVWRVEGEEDDSDPFFTSASAVRQAATATYPTVALTSVPVGATLVWVGAAGSNRSITTMPTGFTRLSPNDARVMHIGVIEDYAGGSPSVSGVASTGGGTSLTAMLFAILPAPSGHEGSATGSWSVSGSATGEAPDPDVSEGSATGSWSAGGSASGIVARAGSATGAWTFHGSAESPITSTEYSEDWADLASVNATGVQVVGNKLYASGSSSPRGYVKAFEFPPTGIWRYSQLIYNVDAGLQNPTIKMGVTASDPALGVVADDANAVGIAMQFATRARSSFKGSGLSAVPIQDEQIVGAGPSVDATLVLDITADEHFISFSLKDVAAVREMIAFRIARSALADAGKTVTAIYAFFTDARTTTGSSLSPFIFQTGTIGPAQTGTVAGQQIEGRGQRIITTKQDDDSPMDWWAATPPDMTDDTPIIIHCPQSLTGDGHDAWTDTRMEPITAAVMGEYIWLSSTDTVDRFGNQIELDNYTALLDWCETHFGAGRDVFLFGTSMGTMVCVNLLGRGIGRALAVIGFAGGFDWLWNNVTEKRPEIRDAFGVASDGSDLRAKTTGYDPLLDFIDDPDFDGKGFRFYTGSSDAITPTELSEDMASIALAAGATEADVIEGTGGHLDSSQYHGDEVVAFYERNVGPNEGSATGSWSASGSATGSVPRAGSSTGSWSVSGTASGKRVPTGSAAGSWSVSGAATGEGEHHGTATGSTAWTTTASGENDHSGGTSGAWTVSGAATGKATHDGTTAGSWTAGGAATGESTRAGHATGSWSTTGTASGQTGHDGSASGSWGADGSGAGFSGGAGFAIGSWTATATTSGERASKGSGAGTYSFAADATGTTARSGSANDGWDATGTATGAIQPSGTASGGWTVTGTASGGNENGGSATGTWSASGTATGRRPSGGTGSGAWSTTGSTTGQASPLGAAVGSFTIAGAAVGQTSRAGVAVGAWTATGTARGHTPDQTLYHRVTITDRSRVTTSTERGRTSDITDRSRTTTIREPV